MGTAARPSGRVQAAGLVGWLLLCFAVAAVGAVGAAGAPGFYQALTKPAWALPARLFGPVWTVLYVMMAIAAWTVWREFGAFRWKRRLGLFLLQLAPNILWTWLFFRWRHAGAAAIDIVLWCVVLADTVLAFWRVRRLAGILLMPYLLWVLYAAALNVAIWKANPAGH